MPDSPRPWDTQCFTNRQKISSNEITTLTPASYGGMSYDRLGINGLQWPCPNADHPGTLFLHKDRFARGLGKFHAVEYRDPAEMPDETLSLFLHGQHMFAHFHTGTMTRISPKLDIDNAPVVTVCVNPRERSGNWR